MKWKDRGYQRRQGVVRSAAVASVALGVVFAGYGGSKTVGSSVRTIKPVASLNDGYNVQPSTGTPVVAMVPTPDNKGYWVVGPDGSVFGSGDAGLYGSLAGKVLNQPIVGMAATPDGKGYWLVASDGGIFTFGDAGYFGSTGAMHLNQPIVGMAATPDGKGYWLVAKDGGIFTFGDAGYFGSTGAMHLNKPIVGMAATKSGQGYWLVASDGGIFTFGDAAYLGSTGAMRLNQPIVGMAATTDGKGYWLVASDGGIFTFGDAGYFGSGVSANLNQPVAGIAPASTGGYWMVSDNGTTVDFQPGSTATPNPAPTPVSNAPATPNQISAGGAGPTWSNFGVTSDASVVYPNQPYREITQPAPASAGYSFLLTQNASTTAPVRWNPCAPVNYQVNLNYAPSNGLAMIQQSLAEITNATGIQFNYDGTTSELPSLERNPVVQTSSGPQWAPVLIAWEPSGATDYLPGGNVIGMGGSSPDWNGSRWVYVTGEAAFSSTYAATSEQEASLLLHELGHVMGMGHVNDPTQVMNPVDNFDAPTTYQHGDLTGLAHLGLAAGCVTTPSA